MRQTTLLSDVIAQVNGHSRHTKRPASVFPRSNVRIIGDDAELDSALEQASAYERGLAEIASERLARYAEIGRREHGRGQTVQLVLTESNLKETA
jgi:hypothetical protein